MFIFHIVLVLLWSLYCVRADVFSAIADLEKLLETQAAIVSDLPNYIQKEKSRIAYLEKQLTVFQKEDEEAMKDVSKHLENPLNAVKIIKRLSHDIHSEGESLESDAEYIKYLKITYPHLVIPTRDDLIGAAQALVRLQITYQLNVTELAEGRLKNAFSSPMSSEDCFVIGLVIYGEEKKEDHVHALPWFMEALRKYREEVQAYPLTEVDILEHIAFSHYRNGDMESAIDWSIKIVALEPNHSRVRDNIYHYFDRLIRENNTLHSKKEDTEEEFPDAATKPPKMVRKWGLYEALCRGEFQLDRNITKRLFCWYSTKHHPFLKLAPIKVEQVYIDPDVFVFHQIITDDEIQHVKNMARPNFDRALVFSKDGSSASASYRISKSSWLKDSDSPVVARITQRITDMTGLSMDTAEEMQVANYGIGGHYEPHFDYSTDPEVRFKKEGNRIATVLFYMSEVAQGGATVFTELGLSVFPIKNAALYWHNLHPSGEGNRATLHAACPVLTGSKWVSNKWIHLTGQEFIRPCTLEFQPESIVRPFPAPLPITLR